MMFTHATSSQLKPTARPFFLPWCSHQVEACKMLIEAGADVNCRWSGANDATLLMVAAIHGTPQLVKIIANHPLVEINAIVSLVVHAAFACHV